MDSSVGADVKIVAGCSKRLDFSPAQPWRLFHPPALSLPKQSLRPETHLFPSEGLPNSTYPSFKEWPRLPFTARIERAHSYCARSASKKGTWPLLPHPSETAALRESRGLTGPSLTLSSPLPVPATAGTMDPHPAPPSTILPRQRNSRYLESAREFPQTIVWLPSAAPRSPDCPGLE